MKWDEAKKLPIGHTWEQTDLDTHFELVRGGIAFPGKKPGFAVVVGLRTKHQDDTWTGFSPSRHTIHVLDEYESWDLGSLLRQCVALTMQYSASFKQDFEWVCDWENNAAQSIFSGLQGDLNLITTPILDMKERPYSFMTSKIKEYVAEKRRMLYLGEGKVKEHMRSIESEEISELTFGAYPAIEALSFVVNSLSDPADFERHRGDGQPAGPYNPMSYIE